MSSNPIDVEGGAHFTPPASPPRIILTSHRIPPVPEDQVRAGLDGYVRGEGWETIIFIADDQLKFQDSRINLKYIVPCVVQQVYFVPTESKMLSAAAEQNIDIL